MTKGIQARHDRDRSTKVVRVAVVCKNSAGEPDVFLANPCCTKAEFEDGDHYDIAQNMALNEGYEGPFVCFDGKDKVAALTEGHDWLDGTTAVW